MSEEKRFFEKKYRKIRKLFHKKTILVTTAIDVIEKAFRRDGDMVDICTIEKALNVLIQRKHAKIIVYLDQKDKTTHHLYIQFID